MIGDAQPASTRIAARSEREALDSLWRGLRLWPTNLGMWKSYLLARLRVAAGWRRPTPQPARSG